MVTHSTSKFSTIQLHKMCNRFSLQLIQPTQMNTKISSNSLQWIVLDANISRPADNFTHSLQFLTSHQNSTSQIYYGSMKNQITRGKKYCIFESLALLRLCANVLHNFLLVVHHFLICLGLKCHKEPRFCSVVICKIIVIVFQSLILNVFCTFLQVCTIQVFKDA